MARKHEGKDAENDVGDIFNDFKYDDGEHSHDDVKKRAQKEFDKGGMKYVDDFDYRGEIRDLRRQVRELKDVVEGPHKGSKRKPEPKHHEHSHFKQKDNVFTGPLSTLERGVLIGIIVLLAGFIVIDLSFCFHCGSKATSENIPIEVGGNVNGSDQNETEEVEEGAEEVIEEEPEPVVDEEPELSGDITLKIDNIDKKLRDDLGEDKGEISSITFTIDNGKNDVLTPVVEVFIYDDESKDDYETKRRGHYTYAIGIAEGKTHTGTISVTPKIFADLDLVKHIRLTLNDTEGGYITAVNDEITIS